MPSALSPQLSLLSLHLHSVPYFGQVLEREELFWWAEREDQGLNIPNYPTMGRSERRGKGPSRKGRYTTGSMTNT